jgi:hypothetical protein
MCFEVGCIEGERRVIRGFGSQTRYGPRQHPHITPPLPTVVDGLGGAGPYSAGSSRQRKPL